MTKDPDAHYSGVESMLSHRCGGSCLGPLTFHCQVFGDKVSLSQGGRLARRGGSTFKNGLVFSSRPLGIQEKIHLKVVTTTTGWHGALRVGFTNVQPAARGLPLPPMAIPDLTQKPGHWAIAVPESCCTVGSELKLWVSSRGKVYMRVNNSNRDEEILSGVDVSRPLWAMIDIYGQTSCIYLQGSEKRGRFRTKRSCPAPQHIILPDIGRSSVTPDRTSCEDTSCHHRKLPADNEGTDCVVCMEREATNTLTCGHRCLCQSCTGRIILEFGSCPLCRHQIGAPLRT
eukprot:XP_003974532.1 PREDICTED: E3 ubiquitin-protein ligase NEURL3-like [Takifugu rubripes]